MYTSLLGEEKHHCDLSCFPRREVIIDLEVLQQEVQQNNLLYILMNNLDSYMIFVMSLRNFTSSQVNPSSECC